METITINFTADSSGDIIIFRSPSSVSNIVIDNVSIKHVDSSYTPENYAVKEFLSGTTDDDTPIFFRADTQELQMNPDFEIFSNPTSIMSSSRRGSLMRCFVSLDNEDFYEIQGTVTKGVSILKIHSKDKKAIISPPTARNIKVSWRDSSKQLCRLTQAAIVFTPGTMDYSE